MLTVGFVVAALAAVLHVYIFFLESLLWTTPRTRAAFGTTVEEAEATKVLAFNQGFYNLFLAIITMVGVLVFATGADAVGAALIFAGTGSMLSAALVLVASSPDKVRAAIMQGALPLVAIVLLAVGLTR